MKEECKHVTVKEGPRIPLRWGSSATEICCFCDMWRTTFRPDGRWKEQPIPLDEDDEV